MDVFVHPEVQQLKQRASLIAAAQVGEPAYRTTAKELIKRVAADENFTEFDMPRARLASEVEAAAGRMQVSATRRDGLTLREEAVENISVHASVRPVIQVIILPFQGIVAYKHLMELGSEHQTPLCGDMYMGTINVPYIKVIAFQKPCQGPSLHSQP